MSLFTYILQVDNQSPYMDMAMASRQHSVNVAGGTEEEEVYVNNTQVRKQVTDQSEDGNQSGIVSAEPEDTYEVGN